MARLSRFFLFIVLGLVVARPGFAQAAPVLSDAVAVLTMPDLQKTADGWQATPLHGALSKLVQTIVNSDEEVKRDFAEAQEKAQSELQLSIKPKDLIGPVFKAATISISIPNVDASEPDALLSIELADVEKADKLIAFVKKDMEEEEAEAATQAVSQPTTQAASRPFTEETILGHAVTVFSREAHAPNYMARKDAYLFITNRKDVLEQVLAGQGPAVALFNSPAQEMKIAPDLLMSINLEKGFEAGAKRESDAQKLRMAHLAYDGVKTLDVAVGIEPNAIVAQSWFTFDPQVDSWMTRAGKFAAADLPQLGYAAPGAWFALATNMVDLAGMWSTLKEGGKVYDEALGENYGKASEMASAALGMDLEKEVLPAFGPNALVALNAFELNPALPFATKIDLLLGIEVKNREKVQQLMQLVEKSFVEKVAPGTTASAPAMSQLITSESYKDVEIRSFQISGLVPLPSLMPSYCFDGDYLLVEMKKDGLKGAIDMRRGEASALNKSEAVTQVQTRFGHEKSTQIGYMNFQSMAAFFKTAMDMNQAELAAMTDPDEKAGVDFVFEVGRCLVDYTWSTQTDAGVVKSAGVLRLAGGK